MVPKNRIASGMFYSKINYNFNKYQNNLTSKNVRSFKSADNSVDFQKDNNEPDNLEETKFSEDEIYRLSAFVPDKKMSEVAKNTVKTMFVTIPVIDSVIAGAVKKGNLASKLKYGAINAGRWGGVIATGLSVFAAKNAVNSKVKPLDDFNKNHPILATIVDLGAICTGLNLLNEGIATTASSFKELFPKFVDKTNRHVYLPVKNVLNNSLINKKLVLPAEKFVEKRPYLGRANKLSSLMVVPAMFIASFVRYNKELKNRDEQVKSNMQFLSALNKLTSDDIGGFRF